MKLELFIRKGKYGKFYSGIYHGNSITTLRRDVYSRNCKTGYKPNVVIKKTHDPLVFDVFINDELVGQARNIENETLYNVYIHDVQWHRIAVYCDNVSYDVACQLAEDEAESIADNMGDGVRSKCDDNGYARVYKISWYDLYHVFCEPVDNEYFDINEYGTVVSASEMED